MSNIICEECSSDNTSKNSMPYPKNVCQKMPDGRHLTAKGYFVKYTCLTCGYNGIRKVSYRICCGTGKPCTPKDRTKDVEDSNGGTE